jgi:selenide,water dikinase
MGPKALAQVLRSLQGRLSEVKSPNLLIGVDITDDAAVYRINDEVAVIQTIDFFPPVVDDPYDYGAIAAANAMSDVYAMGGEVVLGLNVCGFPPSLTPEAIGEILRGGADKVIEAGGIVAGGHTIDDKEPKYGLSVMGIIHPEQIWTKAGAQLGDVLVITKPLGVGVITTAIKRELAAPEHAAGAVESMKRLHRESLQLLRQVTVHACTDVTGFALLGHVSEVAERSGVRIRIRTEALPFLDGLWRYADLGCFPGGAKRNQTCYGEQVTFAEGISETYRRVLFTPETSGGLLVSLPPEDAARAEELFHGAGSSWWRIGDVLEGSGIEVV